MTVDTYGHLMPSMQREVVNGLDDHEDVTQMSPSPTEPTRKE